MLRPMPESDAVNRRLMPLCAGFATMTLTASAHAKFLYEFTFNTNVAEKLGGVEVGYPASFRYVITVEQEDQSRRR